ncbi:MAG TPA: hypothetical protein VG603_11390 [Chitinophagales bacterium]|nr:hypothetical protein [Chitinophagales bacterium]
MNRSNNNFDFIRFVAALLVIVTHSYALKGFSGEDILSTLTLGDTVFSYLAVLIFL